MLFLLNFPVRPAPDSPGGAALPLFYLVAFLAGLVVSVNGPNVRTVLQNVTSPECRGTANAIFTMADDLGKVRYSC